MRKSMLYLLRTCGKNLQTWLQAANEVELHAWFFSFMDKYENNPKE